MVNLPISSFGSKHRSKPMHKNIHDVESAALASDVSWSFKLAEVLLYSIILLSKYYSKMKIKFLTQRKIKLTKDP